MKNDGYYIASIDCLLRMKLINAAIADTRSESQIQNWVFGINKWLSWWLMIDFNGFMTVVSELIFGTSWNNYKLSGGTNMFRRDENLQILLFRSEILKLIWEKNWTVFGTHGTCKEDIWTYRLLRGRSYSRWWSRFNDHLARRLFLLILHCWVFQPIFDRIKYDRN